MNHKDKENSKTHPTLFFIFITLFLCLFSSPSWAVERDALILKARQTGWQGNYDDAIAIYRQLINENPKDIEAMLGLATVLSWQEKYQKSSTLYQKVRKMRPNIPDGELGLLRLRAWQGEYAAAEEGLKAIHSKHPERLDILVLLGQVTAWQEKYQDSIEYYKKALFLRPGNKEAFQGLTPPING